MANLLKKYKKLNFVRLMSDKNNEDYETAVQFNFLTEKSERIEAVRGGNGLRHRISLPVVEINNIC